MIGEKDAQTTSADWPRARHQPAFFATTVRRPKRGTASSRATRTRALSLDPNDNHGFRFCWHDVRKNRSWDEMNAMEA